MSNTKNWNPFATWVVALVLALLPLFGGLMTANVAAQEDETTPKQDGNGLCEATKPQQAFYVYNPDEDLVGYDTSQPKHDPWKMEVGLDVFQHTEVYGGPGLPTFSVTTDPLQDGDTARTVYGYGSQWYWEKSDCLHYDVVGDARTYAKIRAKRGHSGVVVDLNTGKVYMELNDPDTRIYKVSRDDVPALLASFNNAKPGERMLFDGVNLTWADTGEAISLPGSTSEQAASTQTEAPGTGASVSGNGGGQLAASCPVAQPTRVEDAESIAGQAPAQVGDANAYRIVNAWSNQHNPNLNPQNSPNVTGDAKSGSFFLFLKPNEDISGLLGLNGAVWQWPAECGEEAARDFNSKPESLRISVKQYLAWVANINAWPKGGATAKV